MAGYLRCNNPDCVATFALHTPLHRCLVCNDLLEVDSRFSHRDLPGLKALLRERRSSREPLNSSGVWRYREFLPFSEQALSLAVTLGEGNAPLLDAPASATYAGLKTLQVKHLGWNPTGSFKDLGMTVAMTQARVLGQRVVVCASTGNTAASMAAYAQRAGLVPVVLIPEGQISQGKLSQALDYGALTLQIEGDFDRALQLVRDVSKELPLYIVNSMNPFRVEGQKMAAIELLDQRDWRSPDRIVLPAGNLGNASAIGKGLLELLETGLIRRLPRLTLVQAEGAAPLAHLWETKEPELAPVQPARTLATAIQIGNPVSWKKAVRVLKRCEGECISVSEMEIADAKAVLGRDGIGSEPASAVTLAGLRKLVASRSMEPGEDVVALLTGHQLKDPGYTVDYHFGRLTDRLVEAGWNADRLKPPRFANSPLQIEASDEAIVRVLKERIPDLDTEDSDF